MTKKKKATKKTKTVSRQQEEPKTVETATPTPPPAPKVKEPKVKAPRAKREPSLVCSCHGLPWTYSKSGTSRWCKEKDRELRLKAAAAKKPAAPAE